MRHIYMNLTHTTSHFNRFNL